MSKTNTDPYKAILRRLIFDALTKNKNKPINYKQLSSKLKITDEESRNAIRQILEQETVEGNLQELDKGKYILKVLNPIVIGRVSLTADGSAYIIPEDESLSDIYVAPRKLRSAMHGDTVKLHAYENKRGRKKEGEVIEILKRGRDTYTGVLRISPEYAYLIADDKKMLQDIFIPNDALNGAKNGQKAVVTITKWPTGKNNPVGKVKYVLGFQGENDTEMNAIIAENGFPLSFSSQVEAEAEALKVDLSPQEIKDRKDFRETLTFTIDPADAKDFDDALSFKQLENGNFEIGIHIADVSHYIRKDSELDKEAYERGTSVYLVDRVIPMLPERLSNDLCSLKPNEDRLCFSAVFEMNEKAMVLNQWFGKTVIHSDYRLSYEEAQERIERKQGELSNEINTLNDLAEILRNKRFKDGAISFESVETKFKLDENGKPLGVYVRERKEAHKLIEEFMLLANRKVAEWVGKLRKGKNKLTFVYRSHDTPNETSLANFAQFAARFGYKINTQTEKKIAHSLNHLMSAVEGKKEQNMLTQLAIRSMAKAKYTTETPSHYGLGFDYYTHFTSPIRRYPDIMSHRLLEQYLQKPISIQAEPIEKMCQHLSQMEKKAADAERASIKYKQAEYLKDQIGNEFLGLISGVTEWGMYVEIEENKCEGMIRLRDMNDDFYELDEKNYALIGSRKKKRYQLGGEVKIRVKSVDLTKRQIDFVLAE